MEAPLYKPNIFRKQALIESHQHHKKMRALGPLVYLPKQKLFAITRFAELRAALRDDAQLVSGEGISMNWFFNAQPAASLLVSDGADHEKTPRRDGGHAGTARHCRMARSHGGDGGEACSRPQRQRAVLRGRGFCVPSACEHGRGAGGGFPKRGAKRCCAGRQQPFS